MSTKRQKIEKSKQIESSSRSKNEFVSSNALYKHSIICNKHVISGRCVALADFDHLNLTSILKTSSLDYFVTIKEQVYPELVQYFFSNLLFHYNRIKSCVRNVDINLSLERFARIFKLSCVGVEIFHLDLHDFEYPYGKTALTASHLLHDDDNSSLVRNEEVKRYTLLAQVLAKIVFHNLLPKSREYSHARGCVPFSFIAFCKALK